jgi:O-antigen ligase
MKESAVTQMRPVIVGTLVVCVAVAMAPWLSGGQEPVALLVSVGALLLGALLVWRQPESLRLKWSPVVLSWTLLIGWAVLSLWWSADRYSTVLWACEWIAAGLAFRLAYAVAGEPRGREWLLRAYLVSTGLFSVVAVWLYLTTAYPRLTGTFYWPNPAAGYLLPALLLSIDRLRRASGHRMYLWFAASVGLVATFLLTDSRAALIIFVFSSVVYLLIVSLKGFWIKLLCSLVLGFGLSIGLAALSSVTAHHSWNLIPGSRLAQVANGEPTNLHDRLDYVESALAMWWDRPLAGTGAGTYGDVHPAYQQNVESASTNAHNLYAQTLGELGLVGAATLAAVLLWVFIGCLQGLVRSPELAPVALGIVALLAHFGFDIDASYPALLVLAAVLAAVMYQEWRPVRGAVSWRWPAVAALVLAPVISLYQSDVWAARGQSAQTDNDYALAATDYAAAHRGVAYDPDYVDAEGIDWYALAATGGTNTQLDAKLALELARQAEVLDPHDGQHYQLEGRVLALTGDWKGALVAFKTALRLDPYDHPEYALDLATVEEQMGNERAAVETAESMLALYPPTVVVNRNLDTTIRPTLANLEALVGNIELQQGNVIGAQVAAARALNQDPTNIRGRALAVQIRKLSTH